MTPSNQIDTKTLKDILKALDKCILYMDQIILYQTSNINSDKKYYASLFYMVKIGELLRRIKDKHCENIDISQVYGLGWLLRDNASTLKDGVLIQVLKDGALIQVRDMIMHGMFYDNATRELFISFFESNELKLIKQYIANIVSKESKREDPTNKQISDGPVFKALIAKANTNIQSDTDRKQKSGNIQESINKLSENDQENLEKLRDKLKQTSDFIMYEEISNIMYTLNLLIKWGVFKKNDQNNPQNFKYELNTAILDQEGVFAASTQIFLDASTQVVNLMSRHLSILSPPQDEKKIEPGYLLATSEIIQKALPSSEEQKFFTERVLTIRRKRNMLVHRILEPADSRARLLEALTALIEIIPSLYKLQECIHEAQLQYNDNLRPQQDRGR